MSATSVLRESTEGVLNDEALWIRAAEAHDLPRMCKIESAAHSFPWELLHFQDCLQANYACHVLETEGQILGYTIAMQSLDEVHLLNVTVDKSVQGKGLGVFLMQALMAWSLGQGAQSLWLEVRESNLRARSLYDALGFEALRRRKDYYPAGNGQREDAWVMRYPLACPPAATGASDHD